jgi:hypothetical protein
VLGAGGLGRLMATVFLSFSAFLRAIRPEFRPLETRVLRGVFRVSV